MSIMEKNRESPEINHTPTANWSTTKKPRIYNGGKTVSSTRGVGKAGQIHINRLN